MTQQPAPMDNKVGKCMLHNWVEERAVAALDNEEARAQIQRHGHRGIITIDQESKMETVTTVKSTYVPFKSPGVTLEGNREELMKKKIAQMISKKIEEERKIPTPETDYCSTTRRDFCVEGFMPCTPETSQLHDYKTDQTITFWSENRQRIQGVSAVRSSEAPFRKSAQFSTPITERLDQIDAQPDN
ncbi:uncharacterized protein V6R79_001487 [Siganus canaliculatus]